MASNNIELTLNADSEDDLEGYAELARFIGSDPQLSIWRRYDILAARNLLHLEAELQLLQFKISEMDIEDVKILKHTTGGERAKLDAAGRCWEVFLQQAENGGERAVKRTALNSRLKVALEEYGEQVTLSK